MEQDETLGLEDRHWQTLMRLLRSHVPGVEVRAFGSRVQGVAKRWSDLDLILMAQAPVELVQLGQLKEALMESDIPIRVDVVDGARTSNVFLHEALRHSRRVQ